MYKQKVGIGAKRLNNLGTGLWVMGGSGELKN